MFSLKFDSKIKVMSGLSVATFISIIAFILGTIFSLRLIMLFAFISFIGIKILSGMMWTCPHCKSKLPMKYIKDIESCEHCKYLLKKVGE